MYGAMQLFDVNEPYVAVPWARPLAQLVAVVTAVDAETRNTVYAWISMFESNMIIENVVSIIFG
jgi:hypothetical protein